MFAELVLPRMGLIENIFFSWVIIGIGGFLFFCTDFAKRNISASRIWLFFFLGLIAFAFLSCGLVSDPAAP